MKHKNAAYRHSLRGHLAMLIAASLAALLLGQGANAFWYTAQSERRAIAYAQENLLSISERLKGMFDDFSSVLFNVSFNTFMQEYLTTQDSERKYVELYPILSSMLAYIQESNSGIYDILLFDKQGNMVISCQQSYALEIYEQSAGSAKDAFPAAQETILPAVLYGNRIYCPIAQDVFSVSIRSGFMSPIGTCVVLCNGAAIQSLVGGISIMEGAELFVVDRYGQVIASNMPENIGSLFDVAHYRRFAADERVRMEDGISRIIQSTDAGEWTVFSLLPVDALLNEAYSVLSMGLIFALISACILLAAHFTISQRITRSVGGIVAFLQDVSAGHSERRIQIHAPDEITTIANSINQMLDRLEDTNRSVLAAQSELYKAELLQRQTQFAALQRQINPHFLFNTLNCIANIGAVHNVPEIVRIASCMGKIFRYCIKGAEIVTVREEIACVHDYLEIIELRYQGKIRGDLVVDESVLDKRMVKMVLQPIVENVVFHGLEPKRGGGTIVIRVYRDDAKIAFDIRDNGKGMEAEALHALRAAIDAAPQTAGQATGSIGLANIAARIHFLFGDQASIQVDSQPDQGLHMRLYIPEMALLAPGAEKEHPPAVN